MLRRRLPLVVGALAFALAGFASDAQAGLEFCVTPECSDGNPCTCDFLNPDGSCSHDPRSRWASAARAWGLSVEMGGSTVIPPTPDSNATNPGAMAAIPADPAANVMLFQVEELEENPNNNTASHARAVATTAGVKVLDQGGGNWLLTADSLRSASESFATDQTATSSTEGSTLKNVVLDGVNLGDVSEPMEFTIQDPTLHRRIDVRLLQKLRVGGAAGDPVPDPVFGIVVSGVTVNAIRVTVRDVTDPANPIVEADIIVGRADSRVDRFSQNACVVESADVSGSGYVVGFEADETAIDPGRLLSRTRVGEVVLPSRGGADDAHLDHTGPILDGSGNLFLGSKTAFSHTEGQIDGGSGSAQSSTISAIEDLDAFDQGQGSQLTADLIRAECASSSNGQTSTAGTTLAGLTLGGSDVCQELQLGPLCTPEPNTRLTNSQDLDVIVNEQRADPAVSGCTGITVNGVHVHAFGPANSLGLPAGADLILSNGHCDACSE